MFFILSKVLGFLALPSNALAVLGLAGAALAATRFSRPGVGVMGASLVLLAIAGWSPLGNALILPLEDRFPPWDKSRGAPDGIIILGGAMSPNVSVIRGAPALNEAGERMTVAVELARRYPDARMVFTGGNAWLLGEGASEASAARLFFESMGLRGRVLMEDRSRNTIENATLTKALVDPKPGERWLLVTSAYHMPRSIGIFRQAGFPVEAYPVDWRTVGAADRTTPFVSLAGGLMRTDTALREWVGLFAYRISGRSEALFPAP